MVGITQTPTSAGHHRYHSLQNQGVYFVVCDVYPDKRQERERERDRERERESKQRRTRDPFRIANSAQANDLSLPMSCQPTLLFIHNTFWQSSLEINAYPSLNPDYHSHTYTGIQKTI